MHSAIFLDRDGVICQNRSDHVKSWAEFRFLPGALEAVARLSRLTQPIVVVTNQAVINRGMVVRATVEDIHARMVRAIERAGGRVDRVMYCPHRPDEACDCRKPQPGLLHAAARDLGLDLSQSYLVGDAMTDMQAGRAAGCQCYLTLTGRGWKQLFRCLRDGERAFRVVSNLGAAADSIVRHSTSRYVLPHRAQALRRSEW